MSRLTEWLIKLILAAMIIWFFFRVIRFVFFWVEPLVVGFLAGFLVAVLLFLDLSFFRRR
jgi:hypothetical protein